MQLGVVSDTHDNLDLVEAAVEFFEDEGVEAVIHCGDAVAPFSVGPFDSSFDFYYVRGNNDGEWALRSTVESFGTYLGQCGALDFGGVSVAAYHGTNAVLRNALADCGDYDYVLHGHTHERAVEKRGETIRVNPGGLPIPDADDAFHVATIDTERAGTDAVTHRRLG
ncbi:metallophosphoesterase [Halegenticoccus tardaugens]|uniref:metallophosphoesterase n=1 Tax=Halegenticoccus tardaugens TaxID=2071624 RepID=UPI00100ABE7B|nr:metallophosphoesterase [Halegenticoccus tardaugens]